jgi:hypothetical protein
MRLMRAAVAVLAVVVIAWLAVAERNWHLQGSGIHATARQDLARADADFRRASFLNPDTVPDLQRAYVHSARGQRERAIAEAQEVLRREPENRDAWGLLLGFLDERDAPLARRARAELRRLSPLESRR